MRVISGEYGGRPLKAVPGTTTRPTTDKIKESVFHMIGPYFDGGTVLDLYAGSGSLGIEAVSRGMDRAILVDSNFKAIKVIQENVEMTKEPEKFTVLKKKDRQAIVELEIAKRSFELVILDPPYALQEIKEVVKDLENRKLIGSTSMILCETNKNTILPESIGSFSTTKQKVYGSTRITVYRGGHE